MDSQTIIDATNGALATYGGGPFTSSGNSERFHRTILHGELEGRTVRIEVSVEDEPGPYQYSIWLYDEETGKPLGRGNGGADLEEAASIYQWSGALADLRSIEI